MTFRTARCRVIAAKQLHYTCLVSARPRQLVVPTCQADSDVISGRSDSALLSAVRADGAPERWPGDWSTDKRR